LLKNGSRAEELKSCKLKSLDSNVVLSNTCAFDSITSMVMVAFCDSQLFSKGLVKYKTKYIDFITQLVSKGITAYTSRINYFITESSVRNT